MVIKKWRFKMYLTNDPEVEVHYPEEDIPTREN